MKKITNNSRTTRKYALSILLICASALVFNACKKRVQEPTVAYASEMKTYHSSADYKNLLILYPNGLFYDMPIVDANTKMKAILTKIISNSEETVTAMTYFQPQIKRRSNTWYPTIIFRLKAEEGQDLQKMLQEKKLSGSIEMGTTNNVILHSLKLKNNELVFENRLVDGLNESFVTAKSAGGAKLMVASGPGTCLKQMDICATNAVKDMGYFELAACVATAAVCIPILYADCFLHEAACLGLDKPI